MLSNNSWPIRFLLFFFILVFRCLLNKYIHTRYVLLEKLVNYFSSCHRYYYYRQTFIIQWEKNDTKRMKASGKCVIVYVFVFFLKQFCLHTYDVHSYWYDTLYSTKCDTIILFLLCAKNYLFRFQHTHDTLCCAVGVGIIIFTLSNVMLVQNHQFIVQNLDN